MSETPSSITNVPEEGAVITQTAEVTQSLDANETKMLEILTTAGNNNLYNGTASATETTATATVTSNDDDDDGDDDDNATKEIDNKEDELTADDYYVDLVQLSEPEVVVQKSAATEEEPADLKREDLISVLYRTEGVVHVLDIEPMRVMKDKNAVMKERATQAASTSAAQEAPKKPTLESLSAEKQKELRENIGYSVEFAKTINSCDDALRSLVARPDKVLNKHLRDISNHILKLRSDRKTRKVDTSTEPLLFLRSHRVVTANGETSNTWSELELFDMRDPTVLAEYPRQIAENYHALDPNISGWCLLVLASSFKYGETSATVHYTCFFRTKERDDRDKVAFAKASSVAAVAAKKKAEAEAAAAAAIAGATKKKKKAVTPSVNPVDEASASTTAIEKPKTEQTTTVAATTSTTTSTTSTTSTSVATPKTEKSAKEKRAIGPIDVSQPNQDYLPGDAIIVQATFIDLKLLHTTPMMPDPDDQKVLEEVSNDIVKTSEAIAKIIKDARAEKKAIKYEDAEAEVKKQQQDEKEKKMSTATPEELALEEKLQKKRIAAKKLLSDTATVYNTKSERLKLATENHFKTRLRARANKIRERIDGIMTLLTTIFGINLVIRAKKAAPNVPEPIAIIVVTERNGSLVDIDETTLITLSELKQYIQMEPEQSETMRTYQELAVGLMRCNPMKQCIVHVVERGVYQDLGYNVRMTFYMDVVMSLLESQVNAMLAERAKKPSDIRNVDQLIVYQTQQAARAAIANSSSTTAS